MDRIIHYFLQAEDDFLKTMGVERKKLPAAADWRRIMLEDLERPIPLKHFYYLIWVLEGCSVGHSNINKILEFGKNYLI